MAALYVRSTTGSDAFTGASWLLAKATLAGAFAAAAAGDTIYVSQVHAETQASALTATCPGTNTTPCKIVCGNDGAQPPTTLATTATISTTGASDLILRGSFYCYGIIFSAAGGGANAGDFECCGAVGDIQFFEQCSFRLATTAARSIYNGLGAAGASSTQASWKNCTIKFGATTQGMSMQGLLTWSGGSIVSGSSTPAVLLSVYNSGSAGAGGSVLIENVDFSNLAATVVLTVANTTNFFPVIIRNCKLPAAWSGTLLSGTFSHPGRVEMYSCDNAGTNYKLWIEDYMGTIRDETTVVRTGGASDGVTPLSWKISGGGRTAYPSQILASVEFVLYNTTTAVSKTLTVEGLHDSVSNLTDHDVRLDVQYLGSSTAPLGSTATSQTADVLTTANALTISTATWTTTGITNPNKWKLQAVLTPQLKGYYLCRVYVMKASQTIYIDPKITVT